MSDETKENIFKIVQTFLSNPPLIVWGSGATISFGLPSMEDLNKKLKEKIKNFNVTNNNLEAELEKDKYNEDLLEIKKIIWEAVYESDNEVLKSIVSNDVDKFNGIKLLINKVLDIHLKVLNIVTTNYDRVLEYVMSYNNISFTDGFNGKTLSIFNEDAFQEKNIVNLLKVHGSLNWFDQNGEVRFIPSVLENSIPKIIVPSKKKYEEGYDSPYRELIQKTDSLIKDASSFLVIGFGFNDGHLTPKIKAKINKGIPIVLITKKVSENSFTELERAEKYILFEEAKSGKTKVICKENKQSDKKEYEIEGDFWQLNKFMEII